ncbi:dTDP-4-dehydrorhamnose reductase family protein [Pontiella agarivorans]|uniref:dTDP-4-dehydrorhamnose reductase n=1 Tax=Pontiella agarivorans TaxID=3038953 RepID=A0ABU5N1B3_9BACT|nr:SDR family oxidoreductase [Pontiella agarivorans]MDZ8120222.1 SDR family oxidoreductase [Pontiella agarivorans]
MNIMITGASGLLGRACTTAFADLDPVTCAWSRAQGNDLKLDLTDALAVRAAFDQIKPDLIIHTAAERKPDICENRQDLTQRLNVDATRTIATCAAEFGAKMIYISTDYVFDGTQPPYAVDAETNPLNFYGQTKRDGELATLSASADHIVLRVPILYGEVENIEESPVTLMLYKLLNPAPAAEDHWAIRFPTYVGDIAATLRNGLPTLGKASGIYHFSGNEALTKFEMLRIMGEALHLNTEHISANLDPPSGAPRPKNCRLDLSRLAACTQLQQTPFSQNIGRILSSYLKGTHHA